MAASSYFAFSCAIKGSADGIKISRHLGKGSMTVKRLPATTCAALVVEERQISLIESPAEKQTREDPFRQGRLTRDGAYRQTVVIRSYEVGPDNAVTLETLLSLLQETAMNQVCVSGKLGGGLGATYGMMRNNLLWVIKKIHVQVDNYPVWGDVVEIETWAMESGRNGMRREWVIRSHDNGQVFARGTSTWVMINRVTRRLARIPAEVRDEISAWFIERKAIDEDLLPEKFTEFTVDSKYIKSDLKPKRTDLDMNQHVNNVKYAKWMLEAIPDQFSENHQLSSITVEYKRECGISDVVQSICEPDNCSIFEDDRSSVASEILDDYLERQPTNYNHLIRIKGEHKNEVAVKGRTTWRNKSFTVSN